MTVIYLSSKAFSFILSIIFFLWKHKLLDFELLKTSVKAILLFNYIFFYPTKWDSFMIPSVIVDNE